MRTKPKRTRTYVMTGAATLVLAALVVAAVFNPTESTDERHCVVNRPPPKTLVIAIDASDPLVAAQPRAIGFAVEQELLALAKGDHVVVLDAAGKPPAEIMPVVDQCLPGDRDNIARNAFKNEVLGPIETHLRDVKTRPTTPESPLAETVLSVAADASVHSPGSKLLIFFITDALQNSDFQSAYRPGSNFPKLEGAPLKGVTIHLFLVKNERDFDLQPRAVDRFLHWLSEAGAQVDYSTPAWLVLAKANTKARRERGPK